MADLNSFINAVVPWMIGAFFAFLFLRAFREPLGDLFEKIKAGINYFKKDDSGGYQDYGKGIGGDLQWE